MPSHFEPHIDGFNSIIRMRTGTNYDFLDIEWLIFPPQGNIKVWDEH